MHRHVYRERDPFSFSLGAFGMVGSFMLPHALADDRINRAYDARMRQAVAQADRGGDARGHSASQRRNSGQCPVHQVEQPCYCHAA